MSRFIPIPVVPILVATLLTVSSAVAVNSAWAQSPPRDESAAGNVRQSEQYERLVCSNPAFRAKRIQQECGPVTDPELHARCLASFECGAGAPHRRTSNKPPPSETVR
jgi:hypothetical protein